MNKKYILPLFLLAISPMVISSCSSDGASGGGITPSSSSEVLKITLNPCNGDTQYTKNNVISCNGHNIIKQLPSGNAAPTKAGYTFVGWSTKYDKNTGMGSKAYRVDKNQVEVKDSNMVLYAVYVREGLPEAQAQAELEKWAAVSEPNHLYYHYYRFNNQAEEYDDWDVWAWSYAPNAGEGTKFDWIGRDQNVVPKEAKASGAATLDEYAGAYIDIDLTHTYKGGWDSKTKHIQDTDVTYADAKSIGLQIVKTSTRTGSGQFWTNDGSNLYINLDDYAVDVTGGKAYHVFVVQDNVQNPSAKPTGETDPFEGDDGNNTTYGNSKYNNVNWNNYNALQKTSEEFKSVGVGYQIMVSSFADSDGDGFGDIYGIVNKLDYLDNLGVKALWLTPIQLSESYHGYDITDYEIVDPKFGSANSPAAKANGGKVTQDTALEDYKLLIQEAHNRGMKIVMDLVLNHTSTSNSWYVRSANLDDHFRGFYQWGKTGSGIINEDHNWYPYGSHPYSYYAKFGSSMPELNFSYVDTRTAVEEMSIYWARDVGVDGFRLDAVKHIFMENEVASTSGDTIIKDIGTKDYSSDLTKNLQFFRELKNVVCTCSKKNVFFVGENFDGTAYHVAPYYEAFDSLFDFYTYYNLTSGAGTGLQSTTSAYGTVGGFMTNTSVYSTTTDTGNSGAVDNGQVLSRANGKAWNFHDVYATYNMYRNDVSLPGTFTSNHDIARVVNRVAGTGPATGINKQKNITTSEYPTYEKAANLVKIAELMMPGITWVYYGDEIGMTGNIGKNNPGYVDNVDDIPYADLWYRQPMKWIENGQKGDAYGTTDYYVTGSSMQVEQDEVNSSSVVASATVQQSNPNSDFNLMKKFIALKTRDDAVGKALRLGSMDYVYFANGERCSNVYQFERKFGTTTVQVAINFDASATFNGLTNGFGGTVLATYGNASSTALPPLSAIVTVK